MQSMKIPWALGPDGQVAHTVAAALPLLEFHVKAVADLEILADN